MGKDARDTRVNGIMAGLCAPVLFFAIATGISWIVSEYIIVQFSGFSVQLRCIVAVLGNVLPIEIFRKQQRYEAMMGVMIATMALVMGVMFYFWEDFVGA